MSAVLTALAGRRCLAAQDPAVHKTMAEVKMLLKPLSAQREPEITGGVMALMRAAP
jgi:hypothetical protein